MTRRDSDRSKRRTLTVRLTTVLALVGVAAAFLLPHVVDAANPYTTISPQSASTRDIHTIYKLIFWLALAVFIGVQVGIAWTALRYRRRSENEARPEQVHGNKTVEILWTIIPAMILLAIFIPTVRTMFKEEARANNGESGNGYVVEVYGKRWWWEVHYKRPETIGDIVTGNEIYVPIGVPVTFKLYSNNVIHSFWVPGLSGKMDVMPGHENKLGFTADKPGVYFGECAEFCGTSHAYMRFKVIAVDQTQFDAWVVGQRQGPSSAAAALTGGDVRQAPAAFGLCLGCHRIGGVTKGPTGSALTAASKDPTLGLGGGVDNHTLGPNLAEFACRTTIGAGIMDNNEANLRTWLHNPGGVKEGNYMAGVIKEGTLKPEVIDQLVAYLKTLHPEGGCPILSGRSVDMVVQLAPEAVPGASPAAPAAASPAASPVTAASPAPAAAATPAAATPVAVGGVGSGAAASTVAVHMVDIAYDQKSLTVPANTPITINLDNAGVGPHNFNIDALNVHSGDYQPGQKGTVTFTAPPGTYTYYCSQPGHKEAGMVGTLIVQ